MLLCHVEGRAMHRGGNATVILRGGEPGQGRLLLSEGRSTQIRSNVLAASLRHTSSDGIGPLEHASAALLLAGWSNWICEVEGGGLPLLNGDAASFGIRIHGPMPAIRFPEMEGEWASPRGGRLRARASREFRVTSRVGLPDGTVQAWSADEASLSECLRARTFIAIDDLAKALEAGLLQGCEPSQAQILGPAATDEGRLLALALGMDPRAARLNGPERFPDECAAHKVLDLVGDLGLFLGALPRIEIEMENVGHQEFHALGRSLLARRGLLA